MERIQPGGVFAVGVLTILSALAIGFLAFSAWIYETNNAPLVRPDPVGLTLALLTGGFGVLLLADAVLILRGVRAGWYLSIALWTVLLSGVCVVYYGLFSPVVRGSATLVGGYLQQTEFVLLLACPLLYPVSCLTYFLKKNAREYFGT